MFPKVNYLKHLILMNEDTWGIQNELCCIGRESSHLKHECGGYCRMLS